MVAPFKHPQRIRDPVHGLIAFGGGPDKDQNETDSVAWRLINAREFQRLRRIRQLGFSDLVYPGATHTRLSHSIGVYHTARQIIEVIRRCYPDTFDPTKAQVALLASLLHDIGHGPFSHVFEAAAKQAGLPRRHESWGAEIILSDTEVNEVLREMDRTLPARIAALLKEELPKDIYSTVVSSQFDADRLDYIQRDRLMTGVEFAHLDRDWLFDSLQVGQITIDDEDPVEVPCLYLNPKGVQVAEEYLQARFRLYMMVYMHKTTRAAEKMLGELLTLASKNAAKTGIEDDPVLQYFVSDQPSLHSYLDLDDAAVWAMIARLCSSSIDPLSSLSERLRDRQLYKCVDVAVHDDPRGNLHVRFRRQLQKQLASSSVLIDDASVVLYTWYDFEGSTALNKVLVKTDWNENEPKDIANVSRVVQALRDSERIWRAYVPDDDTLNRVNNILDEVRQ